MRDVSEEWRLYRKLLAFGRGKYSLSADEAHDAAADAMIAAHEHKTPTFAYAAECLRNAVYYNRVRSPSRRDVPIGENEDRIHGHFADAELRLVATECLEAIEGLSSTMRAAMRLVARDYELAEIAAELGISNRQATQTICAARALLRMRDLYALSPKRGHRRFVGIKKNHRKWQAWVNVGAARVWVGSFDTAAEAATAYDKRAKELLGEKARLNFTPSTDDGTKPPLSPEPNPLRTT